MQNYENHRHNPKLTRAGFLFLLVSIVGFTLRFFGIGGRWTMALGLGGLWVTALVLLLISRVYTTALQNRIIKLEMASRTNALLSPEQQQTYNALTKPARIALRFASDAELPALVERAAHESMSADQIKRSIEDWRPDWDRT